jgi:hypothetical protein
MLAELETIDKPGEALEWSLGCVGVVLRQAVPDVLSAVRSAGAGLWNFGKESGFPMRSAIIAAAAAVGIALLFFAAPSFRQGMRITASTSPLLEPGAYEYRAATLDRLRAQAERNGDAGMLAFVALHDPRPQIAAQAADQAIAIDPQLTWVYYVLSRPDRRSPHASRMVAALQRWDPSNAVVYLAEAEQIRPQGSSLTVSMTGNPAWMAAMERAFSASRYHSYANQHFELEKEIMFRRHAGDPLQFALAMFAHPVPNLWGIHTFSQHRLATASSTKDTAQLRHVVDFNERMLSAGSVSELERIFASRETQRAYETLEPLVSASERGAIEARITELKRAEKAGAHERGLQETILSSLVPNAIVLQACLVLLLFSAVGMFTATAALVLSPWQGRRSLSTALWLAAATVLASGIYELTTRQYSVFIHFSFLAAITAIIPFLRGKGGRFGAAKKLLWTSGLVMLPACAAAYVAYLPYASLFRQAMNASSPTESMQLLGPGLRQFFILQGVTGTPTGPGFGFWAWATVTVLMLAVLLGIGVQKLLGALKPLQAR